MQNVSDNPYQVSDSLSLESISEDVNQINQAFVNIEIGNKKTPISFKLDTGAKVNVILLHVFTNLGVMIQRARRKGCLAMVKNLSR